MAFQNKQISNSKTGQSIKFLRTAQDTAGNLLEMEATYQGHSKEPAPHYHPFQSEDFKILSGSLNVRMDGQLYVLRAGDQLHIPKNKTHTMWNATPDKTVVNWTVQPALNTEHLLETMTGLANEGKTNADGMPGLLQVCLTAKKYSNVVRLSKLPYSVQRVVFGLLSPFAYLSGYRPYYKKFLD